MRRLVVGMAVAGVLAVAAGSAHAAAQATFLEDGTISLKPGETVDVSVVNTGDAPTVLHAAVIGFDTDVVVSPVVTAGPVAPGETARFTVTARASAKGDGRLLVHPPGGPVAHRAVEVAPTPSSRPPFPEKLSVVGTRCLSCSNDTLRVHWPGPIPAGSTVLGYLAGEDGHVVAVTPAASSGTGGSAFSVPLDRPGTFTGKLLLGGHPLELTVRIQDHFLWPLSTLVGVLLLVSWLDELQTRRRPRTQLARAGALLNERARQLQQRFANGPRIVADDATLLLNRRIDRTLRDFDLEGDLKAANADLRATEMLLDRYEDLLRRLAALSREQRRSLPRWDELVHENQLTRWEAQVQQAEAITVGGEELFHGLSDAPASLPAWMSPSVELSSRLRAQATAIRWVGNAVVAVLGMRELYFTAVPFGGVADYLGILGWAVSLGSLVSVARRLSLRVR